MLLNLYTIISLICAIFVFISLISVIAGVPFVPTHRKQAIKMMELAGIQSGMKVIDLGSGAGRLLFLAAKKGATAVGYELNPFLVLWTNLAILAKGLRGKVTVKWQSIYTADVKTADVVCTFLMERPMRQLEEKLWTEMKSGSKIVSYVFSAPHHAYAVKEEGIYVYTIGQETANKGG